jgi:hypothetical protein
MRRKMRSVLLLFLLALSLGLLGYGLYQGDALLVQDNAAAFCFT